MPTLRDDHVLGHFLPSISSDHAMAICNSFMTKPAWSSLRFASHVIQMPPMPPNIPEDDPRKVRWGRSTVQNQLRL